jgi:hypothetical protein
MKMARLLLGGVVLVSGISAGAVDIDLSTPYDENTSRMLQAYKKEQASCGVPGRELECLSAQFEWELAAEHLGTRQEPGCGAGVDCEASPPNFWGL